MVELPFLVPEIRVQIQVRPIYYRIQIGNIGCVVQILQAYDRSSKQL